MAEPLQADEDAFGRLLLDHLERRAGEPLLERDDGHAGPALPAEIFFAPHSDWPSPNRPLSALWVAGSSTSGREPVATASKPRNEGSTSSPSTSRPERWTSAGCEASTTCDSSPSTSSSRAWGSSTRCS